MPSQLYQTTNMPKCVVQTVDPVTLGCRFVEQGDNNDVAMIPQCVLDLIGGEIGIPATDGMVALVTLGLFSIVQLIRNVQMLVPVYDFCIPEKQCDDTCDRPCDVFSKIKFPTADFFPTHSGEFECGCGCND